MKKVEFVNRIVKQGNSLCVRIPNSLVRDLHLKQGIEAVITIAPSNELYEFSEKNMQLLLEIAGKIKKLDRYSEIKKRFFIMLNFSFLRETGSGSEKERKMLQEDFIKNRYKEFGRELIDEFLDFEGILSNEAFYEDKGVTLIKPEYK